MNSFHLVKYNINSIRTIVYTIFLISGPIKPFLVYYNFPFDITLFAGLLLISDLILNSKFKKVSQLEFLALSSVVLFYIWLVLTISFSESNYYGYRKSILFILNLIAFSYPIIYKKKINLEQVLNIITYVAIPLSIWYILVKNLRYSNFSYLISDNYGLISNTYLGFGLLTGISLLVFFYNRNYIMVYFSIFVILMLGARGALLFTLFVIFPLLIKRFVNTTFTIRRRYLFFSLGMIIPLYLYFDKILVFLQGTAIQRFMTIFKVSQDESNLGRLEHYSFALNHIFSSLSNFLFGEGIGSYGVIKTGIEEMSYPHNVILEILFELGFVGLSLFLIALIIVLYRKSNILLKLIFVLLLLSAMKTQQLSGLRMFYGFMGLTFLNYNIQKRV